MLKEPGYTNEKTASTGLFVCLSQQGLDKEMYTAWSGW